jgi:hypothetical protein
MVKQASSCVLKNREAYLVKRISFRIRTFHASREALHERRTKRATCLTILREWMIGIGDDFGRCDAEG